MQMKYIIALVICVIFLGVSGSGQQFPPTCNVSTATKSAFDNGGGSANGPPSPVSIRKGSTDYTKLMEQIQILNETLLQLRHHLRRLPS